MPSDREDRNCCHFVLIVWMRGSVAAAAVVSSLVVRTVARKCSRILLCLSLAERSSVV